MDKTSVIVGGILLLIVIAGGIFLFSATPAPTTVPPTPTGTTPDPVVSTPGYPIATTDSLVVPTDTSAVVTGSITPQGALTSYWYEYGTSATLGSKSTTQSVGSGYISIPSPAYIVGLVKDTTYYYRVVAQNQYGSVAGVQRSFVTTHGTPAPVGSAPNTRTLAASGVTRSTANLSGDVTPNNATTQYWFEYGTTENLGNTSAFVSVGNGAAKVAASQSLSNLVPLTTYYFRINSQNQFGTVNGSILTFKTTGPAASLPPAATTGSATNIAATGATLRGTVTPNGTAVTYWFEYSTDPTFPPTLLAVTTHISVTSTTNPTSVSAPVTGLKPKTTYTARLVIQNSIGMVQGDEVTFTTK